MATAPLPRTLDTKNVGRHSTTVYDYVCRTCNMRAWAPSGLLDIYPRSHVLINFTTIYKRTIRIGYRRRTLIAVAICGAAAPIPTVAKTASLSSLMVVRVAQLQLSAINTHHHWRHLKRGMTEYCGEIQSASIIKGTACMFQLRSIAVDIKQFLSNLLPNFDPLRSGSTTSGKRLRSTFILIAINVHTNCDQRAY